MKKIILVVLFFGLSCLGSYVLASENQYVDSLESYSVGDLNSQNGWSASGSKTISSTRAYSGTKSIRSYRSAMYGDSDVASLANKTLSGLDSTDDTISFWYYPENISTGTNVCNLSTAVNLNTSIEYFGVRPTSSTSGVFIIDHPSNCSGGVSVGTVDEGNWYFVEIQFDFESHTYKARLDGGDWSSNGYISSTSSYITGFRDDLYSRSQEYFIDDVIAAPLGTVIDPYAYENLLTVIINPPDSGSVIIGEDTCDDMCQYYVDSVYDLSLQASPETDYVFGYWMDASDSLPLSMDWNSESKTVIAKFFKTFPRNTATAGFNQSSGYYGECLEYVEYETELPDDVCTDAAVNCLGQASSKGYATGNTPRVGAIIVYTRTYDNTRPYGHVGIVASIDEGAGTMSIHDSNWYQDGVVHDHTVSINNSSIMGYIYPTP